MIGKIIEFMAQPLVAIPFFGLLVSAIQLFFNVRRDRRDIKNKKVILGYKLVDNLFGDEDARQTFDLIDSKIPLYIKIEDDQFRITVDNLKESIRLFLEAKVLDDRKQQKKNELILHNLDCVLYHLNRFEYALLNDLTMIEAISEPTRYYVNLLKKDEELFDLITEYCSKIGYKLARRFLETRELDG